MNTVIEYDAIVETLEHATGLVWHRPPEKPSFLRNGYYTEVRMIEAPFIVRRLQDAAITGTGRPRAIVFNACRKGWAVINIPCEVAEAAGFQHVLSRMQRKTRYQPAPAAMPEAPMVAAHV